MQGASLWHFRCFSPWRPTASCSKPIRERPRTSNSSPLAATFSSERRKYGVGTVSWLLSIHTLATKLETDKGFFLDDQYGCSLNNHSVLLLSEALKYQFTSVSKFFRHRYGSKNWNGSTDSQRLSPPYLQTSPFFVEKFLILL